MVKKVKKRTRISRKKIHHFTYLFGILNLLVVILFFESPSFATGLLMALGIWGLLIWNSKRTLIVFLFGTVFGLIAEILAVNLGVLEYSFPTSYGIPLWTSFLLGNVAAFIYQKTMEIKERKLE
jgi:uncharacterized membrane protein YoaT (DUF817 family)